MKAICALVTTAILGATALVQDTSVNTVHAKDIKWVQGKGMPEGWMTCVLHGDPAKGAAVTMSKVPAGTMVRPHTHTADEVVTIVSGSIWLGRGETVDESKATLLEAGAYATIPGKAPHWAKVKTDVVFVRYAAGAYDINYIGEAK